MKHILIATLVLASGGAAYAQSVYPVQPLPDYRCMRLAPAGFNPAGADWTSLRTRLEPRVDAAPGLMPQSTAFVRWPQVQRNGFVEVLQVNRTPAWVPAAWLHPWDGRGRCVPSVMNTGLVGAG
jgi:hypothetical protein